MYNSSCYTNSFVWWKNVWFFFLNDKFSIYQSQSVPIIIVNANVFYSVSKINLFFCPFHQMVFISSLIVSCSAAVVPSEFRKETLLVLSFWIGAVLLIVISLALLFLTFPLFFIRCFPIPSQWLHSILCSLFFVGITNNPCSSLGLLINYAWK